MHDNLKNREGDDSGVDPQPAEEPTETDSPDQTAADSSANPNETKAEEKPEGDRSTFGHGPDDPANKSFKAAIDDLVNKENVCPSCKIAALMGTIGDLIVDQTDSVVGAARLVNTVTSAIRDHVFRKVIFDPSAPGNSRSRSKVIDIDIDGNPLIGALLLAVFGSGVRIWSNPLPSAARPGAPVQGGRRP
jgi:hypothetical protein